MTLSDIVYLEDNGVYSHGPDFNKYYYHMFTDEDDDGNICQRIWGLTITKPYKENKVVYLYQQSSSRPSSPTTGYQFYNSSTKKLEWYNGNWFQYDMESYADTGTLYYDGVYSSLYKWNGSTLTSFTPTASEFCVMLLTNSLSGAKKDTWYYSSTNGYLYWYNGNSWLSAIYAKQATDYWLYALNGCVYNVYHASSSDHYFYDYYRSCYMTITRVADGVNLMDESFGALPQGTRKYVYRCTDGYGDPKSMCDLLPGDYADTGTTYRITAEYRYYHNGVTSANKCYLLDGTTNTTESLYTETICGRRGNIRTTLTQTSASQTYNYVGETLSLTLTCTPSSSYPAGLVRPKEQSSADSICLPYCQYYNEYESKYGVIWYITRTRGTTTFDYRELRRLESQGIVKVISGSSSINTSSISIQFTEPGIYYVRAYCGYLPSGSFTPSTSAKYLTNKFYYNESKPSIAIVSVTPSEYQSGSSDPLNGKAPFTVIYQDTSATTDTWQIPQASILVDFGDSDSGTDNTVLINNSTSSLITIPNQTHTYDGYGGYIAKMTITDKRGNSTTGSVAFEPNKTPRIISPPTLTYNPTTMVQPVLATGTANVGGYPAPEVTWQYTCGDYTGTVTGESVELSLIKAGTYTVTCTPENLTTTTWTPTVTAGTVTADDSQTMPDFALIVLDRSGNPVDWCKQHSSIQYIEYYQDLDVFSFEIPQTYAYAQYLQEGDLLVLGYKGFARLMQVTYRGRNSSTITISGESVFPERVTITATKSTASDGYDTQSYKGETLIRYFIASCLTDPYPDTSHTPSTQPRGADFVVFGADGETGGSVTYSSRYNKLRDVVNEICSGANLGYTITARQAGLTKAGLKVTQGTDRTYTSGGSDMVVFSPKRLKNCTIESDQSALSRNVSIGAGAGVGNYRTYSYSGEETTTGFNRREMFTDAGDSADSSEVTRMSNLALKEDRQLSIRIRVLPTCQWTFGTDYDVGDVVTLESPDRGSLDLQIYSAEYCRRATGDELYLNLGYECASAPTLIRRTAKENTYARK